MAHLETEFDKFQSFQNLTSVMLRFYQGMRITSFEKNLLMNYLSKPNQK